MTGTDLLNAAVRIMHETDATQYDDFALTFINIALAETYRTNNFLREHKGLDALASIPRLTALENDIPYEDELAALALPLGVLCRIYVDEDDNTKLSMYKQEYAAAVKAVEEGLASYGEVTDYYGGDGI